MSDSPNLARLAMGAMLADQERKYAQEGIRVVGVTDSYSADRSLFQWLNTIPDIRIRAVLGPELALPSVRQILTADVIVLDLFCADSILPWLEKLRSSATDTMPPTLVMADPAWHSNVLGAFRLGARGVVARPDAYPIYVQECIEDLSTGDMLVSPGFQSACLHSMMKTQQLPAFIPSRQLSSLSEQEFRVARAVAQGLTNAEIAKALQISCATVKTHLYRISRKTGAKSRVVLAVWVAGQKAELGSLDDA